jgi:hypothetical protein
MNVERKARLDVDLSIAEDESTEDTWPDSGEVGDKKMIALRKVCVYGGK